MDTPRSSMAVSVWSSQLEGPRLAIILVERKLKRRSQISWGVMCSDCRQSASVGHKPQRQFTSRRKMQGVQVRPYP